MDTNAWWSCLMVGGGSAAAFTTMRKKEVVKNGCKSHTVRGERGSRRRLGTEKRILNKGQSGKRRKKKEKKKKNLSH